MGSETLDAALRAAGAGLHVHPVSADTKAPLTPAGHHDATTDPKQVAAWWRQWPMAGLAISLEPSGLVALDVDVKNDAGGFESLATIDAELPDTLTAKTRSGGLHAIYRRTAPEQARRKIRWRPGLDVLGKGYIVAAPTPGYEWLRLLDPAPLPPVLAAAFTETKRHQKPKTKDVSSPRDAPPAPDYVIEHARARLQRHGPSIQGQGGDNHLYQACAILSTDYELPDEQALELLRWWRDHFPENEWSDDRLETKFQNAENYATGEPGGERIRARWEHFAGPVFDEIAKPQPPKDTTLKAVLKAAQRKGSRSSNATRIEESTYLSAVLRSELVTDDPVPHAAAVIKAAPTTADPEQLVDVLQGSLGSRERATEALNQAWTDGARPQGHSQGTVIPGSEPMDLALDSWAFDANGTISTTAQHNIDAAFHKGGASLCFDEFAHNYFVTAGGESKRVDDAVERDLWLRIDEAFGFRPTKDFFREVLLNRCERNTFHPVRAYLDQLRWDGTERIGSWLVNYAGADDTPYTRAVGRIVLIAATRRVRKPGAKFDEMLILESAQGTNKSTALKIMAVREEWFTDDIPLNGDSQKAIERLEGHWIVEAGELKGMRKGEVSDLKAFLSRPVDKARRAYGRHTDHVARQCIIIGTTNDGAYLRDTTGNRRFWPVAIKQFDLDKLRNDRDQLWAEASAAEAQGESIRLDPALYSVAAEEQAEREVENAIELILCEAGLDEIDGIISRKSMWELAGLEAQKATAAQREEFASACERLGWLKTRRRRGTKAVHAYAKGSSTQWFEARWEGMGFRPVRVKTE